MIHMKIVYQFPVIMKNHSLLSLGSESTGHCHMQPLNSSLSDCYLFFFFMTAIFNTLKESLTDDWYTKYSADMAQNL